MSPVVVIQTKAAAPATKVRFTFNGYTFGGDAPIGVTLVRLDLPIGSTDQPRTRAHGVVPGLDFTGGLTIECELLLPGIRDAVARELELRALETALVPQVEGELPLTIELPGRDAMRVNCRRRRSKLDVNRERVAFGTARPAVQFFASDPLLYSDTEHSAVTTRQLPGAGFDVPFTPPFTLGASTGGAVSAPNVGTADAPWTARLDGPLTNPQIRHVESGRYLNFAASGGLDIGVGQWLDLSSANESALLLGTADRWINLTLDSQWFDLQPGPNTIELTATTGTGTMTFSWRDAWWTL